MIDITQVVTALLGLILVVISTVVVPYMKQKLSAATIENIRTWVKIAVSAAEMLYAGSGRGEEKKKHVIETLTEILAEKGIKFNATEIDNMIESSVLDLKKAIASK